MGPGIVIIIGIVTALCVMDGKKLLNRNEAKLWIGYIGMVVPALVTILLYMVIFDLPSPISAMQAFLQPISGWLLL